MYFLFNFIYIKIIGKYFELILIYLVLIFIYVYYKIYYYFIMLCELNYMRLRYVINIYYKINMLVFFIN